MSYAYDFNDELPQKPHSLLSALQSDAKRTGIGIINALSSIPRFVQSHQQEYKPGISVADMPQTMEILPEAAETTLGLPAMTGVASVPGISLASGLRRPPPALEVYHGTSVPRVFEGTEGFKPSLRDLGVSSSIDPDVASFHANRKVRGMKEDVLKPRVIPAVADIKSALKFPGRDPTDWTTGEAVIGRLEQSAREGKPLPKGMLADFENIDKQYGGFSKNFIPAMKEKGFDSVYFPHQSPSGMPEKYNSFLTFDQKQVIPKYLPEGQELIKERGIHQALKTRGFDADAWFDRETGKLMTAPRGDTWRMPQGIIKPYSDEIVPGREHVPRIIVRENERMDRANADRQKLHELVAEKFGVTLSDPSQANKVFNDLIAKYGDEVGKEINKVKNAISRERRKERGG